MRYLNADLFNLNRSQKFDRLNRAAAVVNICPTAVFKSCFNHKKRFKTFFKNILISTFFVIFVNFYIQVNIICLNVQ